LRTISSSCVAEYYNEQAKRYDRTFKQFYWRVSDAITWNYLQRYLPKNYDSIILDAAGGTGRWATPIAKKGYKVVLVDISQAMLDVANEKIRREGLQDKVTLVKGDMAKLDYPDGFFDFAFCLTDALPLVEDIDKTLQEFRRVMKNGSYVIADLINRFNLLTPHVSGNPYNADKVKELIDRLKKETSIPGKPKEKELRWLWHFPHEAREIFERNNLEVEKVVGKPTSLIWRNPLAIGGQDLQPSRRLIKNILKLELALCEEPTLLGMSAKLMIIARKD